MLRAKHALQLGFRALAPLPPELLQTMLQALSPKAASTHLYLYLYMHLPLSVANSHGPRENKRIFRPCRNMQRCMDQARPNISC